MRLCYRAEDRDAGLYALDSQSRTVEQAVDRMQYYQHSRQTQSSKPEREVRQMGPEDDPPPEDCREFKRQVNELVKRLGD
jgi:hypothetical protein